MNIKFKYTKTNKILCLILSMLYSLYFNSVVRKIVLGVSIFCLILAGVTRSSPVFYWVIDLIISVIIFFLLSMLIVGFLLRKRFDTKQEITITFGDGYFNINGNIKQRIHCSMLYKLISFGGLLCVVFRSDDFREHFIFIPERVFDSSESRRAFKDLLYHQKEAAVSVPDEPEAEDLLIEMQQNVDGRFAICSNITQADIKQLAEEVDLFQNSNHGIKTTLNIISYGLILIVSFFMMAGDIVNWILYHNSTPLIAKMIATAVVLCLFHFFAKMQRRSKRQKSLFEKSLF